jgi:hypothetical protein
MSGMSDDNPGLPLVYTTLTGIEAGETIRRIHSHQLAGSNAMGTGNRGRTSRSLVVWALGCAVSWLALTPGSAFGAAPPFVVKGRELRQEIDRLEAEVKSKAADLAAARRLLAQKRQEWVRTDPEQIKVTQGLFYQAERARWIAYLFRKTEIADRQIREGLVGVCEAIDKLLYPSKGFGWTKFPLSTSAYNLLLSELTSRTKARIWAEKAASLYLQLVRRLEQPGAADHLGHEGGIYVRFRAGGSLVTIAKYEEALSVYEGLTRTSKVLKTKVEALGGMVGCQAALGKVMDVKRTLAQIEKLAVDLPARERKEWLRWLEEARQGLKDVLSDDENPMEGDGRP